MKRTLSLLVLLVLGLWTSAPAAARGEDPAGQALKGSATRFEIKMRILEGSRGGPAQPAKPVTASFLKFQNFINFDTPEDMQVEQQIRKLYSLKELSLVTEAPILWEKGLAERAFHMFRINGQEYLVLVTPGRLVDKNQFRIEVYEQSSDKKASLLDTEFSLPDKSAAVFGFENTEGKPYFISLRITGWGGALGGAWSGGVPLYPGSSPKEGEKVMPPKLVREVSPVYPEAARKAGVEGVVILEATTDTYGGVAKVKVLRSIPLLDQAAIDALKQWVYEPVIVDGKPVPMTFTVTVQFKLDDKKPEVGGVVGGIYGGVEGGVQGGVTGGVEGGVAGGVSGQDLKAFEKGAVRAVGKIEPPKLLKEVAPVYPEIARQAQVEGTVILEIKADEQGHIVDVRVLRSIPLLDMSAIEAVKQWKYEPLVIDGKPRPVIFTVTVRFLLDSGFKKDVLKKFAAGAIRAEGEIQPPQLLKEVTPVYPEAARQAEVQGTVILAVKANEEGRIVDAVVLRSIPLLDQAALDAVKQWVYEPKIIDGKAAPIVFTVTVRFVLK